MKTILAVFVTWMPVVLVWLISQLVDAPDAAGYQNKVLPTIFLFAFVSFIFNGYFGTRTWALHEDNWSLVGVILCIASAVVSGYLSLPSLPLLLT